MRITRRLTAFPILVLALAGATSGCGAAATGIVLGISMSDGSSGGSKNHPPEIVSPRVIGDPYDQVTIECLLVDGRSDPADITVEVSTDAGGSWAPPTIPVGPLTGLSSSPSGRAHTFVWDSFADLGCVSIPRSDLIIRVTARDSASGDDGDPALLSFDLLNNFIAWITTVAGGGISANALAGPVIDASNDLVLCDITGHQVVRKLDADGTVEILAGTGFAGFNGDGLLGRDAKLNGPSAAVIDLGGDIIFTDTNNHRICRVDFSGFLTTEIGTGLPGFVEGPVGIAWLDSPKGLAIDANGNLYVADSGNHRVRVWNRQPGSITVAGVTIAAGEIRTIAGDGTAGPPADATPATAAVVPDPALLAIDAQGNLYTTSRESSGSDRVRAINPSSSSRTILGRSIQATAIGTVAGGGIEFADGMQATTANLGEVSGIAIDGSRMLLGSWSRIREVDASGILTTIAGDGTRGFGGVDVPRLQAQFDFTSSLVVNNIGIDPAGNVILTMLDDIRVVNLQGSDLTRSGVTIAADTVGRITPGSDLEPYVQAKVPLIGAGQVAAGAPDLLTAGEALIADGGSDRVVSVDAMTGAVTTVAGINGFGGYAGDGGPAGQAGLRTPGGIAVDASGNLYIADTGNHVIRFVNRQGSQKTFYSGAVVVQDGEIATIAGTGVPGNADGGAALLGEFSSPRAVALDSGGNIYVADTGNNAIRAVNTQGSLFNVGAITVLPDNVRRVAGDWSAGSTGDQGAADLAQLSSPEGIGLDSDGNLYIADTGNDRIRIVNASPSVSIDIYDGTAQQQTIGPGIIDTIAGGGSCAGLGDGGPATAACLPSPRAIDTSGLTVTAGIVEGWVLVSAGSRIRAINTGSTPDPDTIGGVSIDVGAIDTIAGTGQPASSGDGGAALTAEILDPAGIHLDGASGLLLVQEPSGLRAINLSSSPVAIGSVLIIPDDIDSVVGAPVGTPPLRIADPGPVVAEPDGDLLIADGGKLIYHVDRSRDLLTRVAGDGAQEGFAGDGGPASGSRISSPGDLALDPLGNLYIADTGNARIRLVNRGAFDVTVAGVTVGPGEIGTLVGPADGLMTPVSLAIDPATGDIYFADMGDRRVRRLEASSGTVLPVAGSGASPSAGDGSPAMNAEVGEPRAIAFEEPGIIYVVDSGYSMGGARIRAVNVTGSPITLFAGTTSEVVIADGAIDAITGWGFPLSQADFIDARDLSLPAPYPDEILLAPSGISPGRFDIFYTHGGGGSRVRRIDAVTGLVTTAAGTFGVSGFNGDGIPATMAELNGPTGLAWFTDINGKILMVVSDTDNRRVRRFAP